MAVVFSDALVLTIQADPALSAKFARIAWDKEDRLEWSPFSSETAGYPASAANNEMTYSAWKPTTGDDEWWQIRFVTAKTINYCGIAAHTLADVGASVKAVSYTHLTLPTILRV